ncbi:hypothetical protein H0H92_013617 [Tricholoma furcatifolium]|nr:hypothetical protein H0H92_013617 [Tricholoma furcatifolium]
MDACEHEYESMSRHNRKVPASFYHRFTRDARVLSDKYAQGKLISVLEGGYSDRALASGAMAHLCGLVDDAHLDKGIDEEWWSVENLVKLEKATKKRRGGRPSVGTTVSEPWLQRTVEIFQSLDTSSKLPSLSAKNLVPPSSRTLRDRKSKTPTPIPSPAPPSKTKPTPHTVSSGVESSSSSSSSSEGEGQVNISKKIPRVILKLGPNPASGS